MRKEAQTVQLRISVPEHPRKHKCLLGFLFKVADRISGMLMSFISGSI
jgi:hypothetical protein